MPEAVGARFYTNKSGAKENHLCQRIMGMARKAITEYDMIQNGDRVAVGVSGGKDSVALTPMALHWLRRFIGIDYEVVAITLDPCFGGVECDYSPLAELFEREGIKYVIKRTNIGRWYLMSGRRQIPAVCVPRCAGALCMTQPRSWAAINWLWAITRTMR